MFNTEESRNYRTSMHVKPMTSKITITSNNSGNVVKKYDAPAGFQIFSYLASKNLVPIKIVWIGKYSLEITTKQYTFRIEYPEV